MIEEVRWREDYGFTKRFEWVISDDVAFNPVQSEAEDVMVRYHIVFDRFARHSLFLPFSYFALYVPRPRGRNGRFSFPDLPRGRGPIETLTARNYGSSAWMQTENGIIRNR